MNLFFTGQSEGKRSRGKQGINYIFMFFSIHGITTYHNENDEWEYSKTYLKHKREDGRENYNYLKA